MQEVNDAERSEIQMLRESLSEARRQQEMVLHDKNLLLSQSVSVLLIFVVVFASGPILGTSRKSEQKENWNDIRILLLFFSLSLLFLPHFVFLSAPHLPPSMLSWGYPVPLTEQYDLFTLSSWQLFFSFFWAYFNGLDDKWTTQSRPSRHVNWLGSFGRHEQAEKENALPVCFLLKWPLPQSHHSSLLGFSGLRKHRQRDSMLRKKWTGGCLYLSPASSGSRRLSPHHPTSLLCLQMHTEHIFMWS